MLRAVPIQDPYVFFGATATMVGPHTPMQPDGLDWLDEGFLTTTEAAELFRGVLPEDVRRWCRAGLVRYQKEGRSGWLLVSDSDLRAIAKYCGGQRPIMMRVRMWRERREALP
jgi:hypothetical protein